MFTVWRGICLSHNPAIEFDLVDPNGHEPRSAEEAKVALADSGYHAKCDVILGGYSYPLVRVACPCDKHRYIREWDITDLQLVVAAHRAGVRPELGQWLNRNNCLTLTKLENLVKLAL